MLLAFYKIMDNNKSSLYNYLLKVQGKSKVLFKTKSNLSYETNNLQVLNEDAVIFTDRLGNRVYLRIDQISQITEVAE